MNGQEKRTADGYPVGRGYGHDYMRGGEVFGGYGYSDRPEYEQRRGETGEHEAAKTGEDDEPTP